MEQLQSDFELLLSTSQLQEPFLITRAMLYLCLTSQPVLRGGREDSLMPLAESRVNI